MIQQSRAWDITAVSDPATSSCHLRRGSLPKNRCLRLALLVHGTSAPALPDIIPRGNRTSVTHGGSWRVGRLSSSYQSRSRGSRSDLTSLHASRRISSPTLLTDSPQVPAHCHSHHTTCFLWRYAKGGKTAAPRKRSEENCIFPLIVIFYVAISMVRSNFPPSFISFFLAFFPFYSLFCYLSFALLPSFIWSLFILFSPLPSPYLRSHYFIANLDTSVFLSYILSIHYFLSFLAFPFSISYSCPYYFVSHKSTFLFFTLCTSYLFQPLSSSLYSTLASIFISHYHFSYLFSFSPSFTHIYPIFLLKFLPCYVPLTHPFSFYRSGFILFFLPHFCFYLFIFN